MSRIIHHRLDVQKYKMIWYVKKSDSNDMTGKDGQYLAMFKSLVCA